MKSMTYAQKADLVAKCKRVFESVKRSNQVAMAESYCDRALKAVSGSYELDIDIRKAFTDMDYRIKNKPRYRYDNRAGEWVLRKSCKDPVVIDFERNREEVRRQQNEYLASLNPLSEYAEQQRRGMMGCPGSGFGGISPLTGW